MDLTALSGAATIALASTIFKTNSVPVTHRAFVRTHRCTTTQSKQCENYEKTRQSDVHVMLRLSVPYANKLLNYAEVTRTTLNGL